MTEQYRLTKSAQANDVARASTGHVPALDGIRAVAIAAVMAFHAGVPGAAAGWLGVDLFFALSGFLITTLICNEIARTGRFDFAYFWIRRGLRIFPPYYAYVAGITAAAWMGFGTLSPHHGYTPELWTASL